ncbi:hypothetical protein V6N13_033105 [Hibiscus sabdariffa]
MESNKCGLVLVAMAAMLLFATAPTVMAARNKVMAFSIVPNAKIRNPLANIFFAESDNAANGCLGAGGPCLDGIMCCSGTCITFPRIKAGVCA